MNEMIDMDVERVPDVVDKFMEFFKKFQRDVEQYDLSRKGLEGWQSPAKVAMEKKMKDAMPNFESLLRVLESYPAVAHQARERLVAIENSIMRNITDD